MNDFASFLRAKCRKPKKKNPFFVYWVARCNESAGNAERPEASRVGMFLDEVSSKREDWQSAEDELVRRLRLRHRSFSTEKTYLGWLRRFATYLRKSAKGVSR